MSDRWHGPLLPSITTVRGNSSEWIQADWPSLSRSSPSLPLSALPHWCTEGGQRLVESWVGPGLRRSWLPCCSSACGSSTSSSRHWRPTVTSRASKIVGDDEGKGNGEHEGRSQAICLIHQSLPLPNTMNDGWMDGCIDEGRRLKASFKILERNMKTWKDDNEHDNHRA